MGICQFFEEVDEATLDFLKRVPDDTINQFIRDFLDTNYYTNYGYDVTCAELPDYSDNTYEAAKTCVSPIATLRAAVATAGNDAGTVYMECKSGGSRKFYKISLSWTTVIVSYGKIGTSGAEFKFNQPNVPTAKKFMEDKIAEKKKGGYKPVIKPNPLQDHLDDIDKHIAELASKDKSSSTEAAQTTKEAAKTDAAKKGTTKKEASKKESTKKDTSKKIQHLSRTEVGKLKKAEAEEMVKQLGIEKGLYTLAQMKVALNEYFKSHEQKDEDEEAKEEEDEEPPKKTRKIEKETKGEEKQAEKTTEKKETSVTLATNFSFNPPDTVLQLLFGKLSGAELAAVSGVCKKWNKVMTDDGPVWEAAYMNQWGKDVNAKRLEAMKARNVSWKTHYTKQYGYTVVLNKSYVGYVDKAGDAIEYLIARLNNLHDPKEKYPQFPLHKHLNAGDVGDQVCYGPAICFDAANTKKLYKMMENVSMEKLLSEFNPGTKDFPLLLGGLEPKKENRSMDAEYIGVNYLNLRALVANAARRGHGLLRHMW